MALMKAYTVQIISRLYKYPNLAVTSKKKTVVRIARLEYLFKKNSELPLLPSGENIDLSRALWSDVEGPQYLGLGLYTLMQNSLGKVKITESQVKVCVCTFTCMSVCICMCMHMYKCAYAHSRPHA